MSDLPEPPSAWSDLSFWHTGWPALSARLDAEETPLLPPRSQWFTALELTPPEAVRVVILGQDPYPTPGHANGLAFSVTPQTPLPRSLRNIYTEMTDDLGAAPDHGDLSFWAEQGVLLLNTALTVPTGQAGAHGRIGWAPLISEVLDRVMTRPQALVLWGAKAQALIPESGPHLRIASAHPSPLSARRGFFGSRPFSRINRWLDSRDERPINWTGKEQDTP